MALLDSLLLDPCRFDIWIAARGDGISGSGTAADPYDASTRREKRIGITLVVGTDTREVTDARKGVSQWY
jgi:hypothetical protein